MKLQNLVWNNFLKACSATVQEKMFWKLLWEMIKDLTRWYHEQVHLMGSALNRWLHSMISRGCFQPQCFSDSVWKGQSKSNMFELIKLTFGCFPNIQDLDVSSTITLIFNPLAVDATEISLTEWENMVFRKGGNVGAWKNALLCRSLECIIKFGLNAKVCVLPTENKPQILCKWAFPSFIFSEVFSSLVPAHSSLHRVSQDLEGLEKAIVLFPCNCCLRRAEGSI